MESLLASLGIVFATSFCAIGAALGIGGSGSAIADAITKRVEVFSRGLVVVVLAEAIAIYGLLVSLILLPELSVANMSVEIAAKILSAGLAVGLCGIGAGLGIGKSGGALIDALTYSPESFSKGLLAVVLSEAIAIYGLLISLVIISQPMGGAGYIERAIASGVVVGLCGFGAGIGIGKTGAGMIRSTAAKLENFSKTIIPVVLAEAMAIYGLLIAFILVGI